MAKKKSLLKRNLTSRRKSNKNLKVSLWLVDGFLGILALVIYNFILYLTRIIGIKGFISEIEQSAGSFGINAFASFNFSPTSTFIGILLIFAFSFFLGIKIGKKVRKYRGKKF